MTYNTHDNTSKKLSASKTKPKTHKHHVVSKQYVIKH